MAERLLLDCTLRDGGYINDWEFGHEKIVAIFERLVAAGVEFIEVGFLDDRRKFDINRTIMPNTEAANKIFEGLDKGKATVVAMIDYGTCDIKNLQPASETFLDGIRVIFKEHLMHEALDYCAQVKALGYKVFAQMVSVTTYTDEKLKEYAELVNKVMPYGNSMVDTYGLLHPEQLLHISAELNKHLAKNIVLGFHAHNNFQVAYANSITHIECKYNRTLLVDSTLYGMGKSAGNAATELVAMYMNERKGKHYDTCQVLEAIDNVIMEIYQKQYWGYNLFFYIASSTKCHPNYVSYFMNKKTLSVKQIMELLNSLVFEKKLLYDAKYAEQMYLDYQDVECDDKKAFNSLMKRFKGHEIFILGPGKKLRTQKKRVVEYLDERKPLTVSINFAPKTYKVDYIFLTNAKRYNQLLSDMKGSVNENASIIATSNVTKTQGSFAYVLNYSSLIDPDTEVIDNSLVMLLKACVLMGVKKVSLAGCDGYSKRTDNYFNTNREYSYVKDKSGYLNKYVRDYLAEVKEKLDVNFVTTSLYNK